MSISDERDPTERPQRHAATLVKLPGGWEIVTDTGSISLWPAELHSVWTQLLEAGAITFPIVREARAWAEARQASVEVFASVTADSAARTAAWDRFSEAERALLNAVKELPMEAPR